VACCWGPRSGTVLVLALGVVRGDHGAGHVSGRSRHSTATAPTSPTNPQATRPEDHHAHFTNPPSRFPSPWPLAVVRRSHDRHRPHQHDRHGHHRTIPGNSQDVEAAERVLVDHTGVRSRSGRTLPWHVHYSKTRDIARPHRHDRGPTGSHVRGNIALGTFLSEGRLG